MGFYIIYCMPNVHVLHHFFQLTKGHSFGSHVRYQITCKQLAWGGVGAVLVETLPSTSLALRGCVIFKPLPQTAVLKQWPKNSNFSFGFYNGGHYLQIMAHPGYLHTIIGSISWGYSCTCDSPSTDVDGGGWVIWLLTGSDPHGYKGQHLKVLSLLDMQN